ncbi:MAG: ATP-binding protein, partial [Candidatus Methanomethylicaceae archaeon]
SMLLFGSPGTGKTLAAEAVAHELGRKLLWVSGSDLVSKWHGEDERHTAAVFRRARAEGAVLLFDEADSFFFARHEVRHSTDVSENRTVNVILGCLEEHELPVVLTTNRADALDPALERRLTLKIAFPLPGPKERERIWELHLPPGLPLAEDVDIASLAEKYELPGGKIKNAVLAAARRSIIRSKEAHTARITMQDLERACRDEYESERLIGGRKRKVGFLT